MAATKITKLNEAMVNIMRVKNHLMETNPERKTMAFIQMAHDLVEEVLREEILRERTEWEAEQRLQQQQQRQQQQQQLLQQQQQSSPLFDGEVQCKIDCDEFAFSFTRKRPACLKAVRPTIAKRGRPAGVATAATATSTLRS